MTPLISVVLTVRDGARFLGQAIESITAQTFPDWELVVVDDGSVDQTPEVLAGFRDKRIDVLRQSVSRGPCVAANIGLARAQGRYIARFDADDVSLPQRLERQVELFEQDPALVLLGSGAFRIDETGGRLGEQPVPSGAALPLRAAIDAPFVHSSMMWRASAQFRYAPELRVGGDYELWSRALLTHPAQNLTTPLVEYREWGGSLSATRREMQQAMHDAFSWRFTVGRWPHLAGRYEAHRAMRAWASRSDPELAPSAQVQSLIEELVALTGGAPETLTARLGELGQPRVRPR